MIPVIVALALLCTVAASASAITIRKEKSKFQKAAESGNTVQVTQMEDFRYTSIDPAKIVSEPPVQGDETPVLARNDAGAFVPETHEVSADPKVDIYNRMLNSIDYFNNVSLTMETSMLGDGVVTVEYTFDIQSGTAYRAEKSENVTISETYSEGSNMVRVDNLARTYMQNYLPTYTRSDTPYIPLDSRITTAEDGIPTYTYRRNITNCPLASYSVVPQEIAFSYLEDFDKWDITDDNVTFLGRSCVKISGTPSPYIAAKHNIDRFTMVVDSATGILLDFSGTLGETVSRYMTVTECALETRTAIPQFSADNYAGYTEINRW